MQKVSALYRKLLADPEHVRETKATVAGVEYGQNQIYACSVSGGVLPDMAIGNCHSRELDLTIEGGGPVPRMAVIALFVRLSHGEEVSEWVPSGVFYVDTRALDEASGLLSLHGFDAMLKAEAVWWDPSEDAGEWPMSQKRAAADIARRMGVSLDSRTCIQPDYMVEYPNDLTMREVLSHIAMAHGGNWRVTGAGELLLAPVGALPEETRLLVDREDGGAILFGEVRILV